MIVKDKAGCDVDVGGDVWVFYDPHRRFTVDWTIVADLPPFVTVAAKRYAIKLLRSGAPSCAAGFFRDSICPLLRCPSAQHPATALTELTFDELRRLVVRNKAALQRYRKFYRDSYKARMPGFDRASSRVMDSIPIGQHRPPAPLLGRNPPLKQEQVNFLHAQIAAHRDSLPLAGRVAVGLSLSLGPNADPMALARGGDLSGESDRPKFGVVQHKKRHPKARYVLRDLPIGPRLAADIRALDRHNAELAAAMVWPDGTIGIPPGVEVPLFMRRSPKPSHVGEDCPMREFALQMTPNEVSELIRDTVATICRLTDAEPIYMTARTGRRTVFTEAQRAGLPASAIAFIGGHRGIGYLGNYAAEGLAGLEHVERALGDRLAEICSAFVPVASAHAAAANEIVLKLRKPVFGPVMENE